MKQLLNVQTSLYPNYYAQFSVFKDMMLLSINIVNLPSLSFSISSFPKDFRMSIKFSIIKEWDMS